MVCKTGLTPFNMLLIIPYSQTVQVWNLAMSHICESFAFVCKIYINIYIYNMQNTHTHIYIYIYIYIHTLYVWKYILCDVAQ